MRTSFLAMICAALGANIGAAPAHYFVTTAWGLIPPLANPIAAKQYIDTPSGVAYDAHGNLYYANLNQVWRLNADGTDTLIAGTASASRPGGDGGPATAAGLPNISALAFDAQQNLYIASSAGIRKVTTDQKISTLVASSNPYGIYGMALDSAGNIYVSDYAKAVVAKYALGGQTYQVVAGTGTSGFNGDGAAATKQLGNPAGLAVSGSLLFIADVGDAELRQLDLQAANLSKVIALGATSGLALTVGPGGTIYFGSLGKIFKFNPGGGGIQPVAGTGATGYSGDGGAAPQAAIDPFYLAVNPLNGDIAIADQYAHVFRMISAATGKIQTVAGAPHFAGDNGPAVLAQFEADPQGIDADAALASDGAGKLYFFDRTAARIRKISQPGIITTIAGNGIDGNSGDGGKALLAAISGDRQGAVAVDKAGNVYFVNTLSTFPAVSTVRRVDANGNIGTVAGGGTGPVVSGVPATGVALGGTNAIAVDSSGTLYLTQGSQILKVDGSGNLAVVAGTGSSGNSPDGTPATGAKIGNATALAFSSTGSLYFTDGGFSLIRMIDSRGLLVTLAGTGQNICCTPPVVGLAAVPAGTSSGIQPLVITVGGVASPPGVYITVQQ